MSYDGSGSSVQVVGGNFDLMAIRIAEISGMDYFVVMNREANLFSHQCLLSRKVLPLITPKC